MDTVTPTAYREPYTLYPCAHTEVRAHVREVGQLIGAVSVTAIALLWIVALTKKRGTRK